MTDTGKLQDCIDKSGLKQAYIANVLGLSSYGFARKRDNKSAFTAAEIASLCDLLHITRKEMLSIFFAKGVD